MSRRDKWDRFRRERLVYERGADPVVPVKKPAKRKPKRRRKPVRKPLKAYGWDGAYFMGSKPV